MSIAPSSNPRLNREYVEQRLREKRMEADMRRIAEPIRVDNSADYWFWAFQEEQKARIQAETKLAEVEIVLRRILNETPVSRTYSVTEVY